MKTINHSFKIAGYLFVCAVALSVFSCGSAKVEEPAPVVEEKKEPVVEVADVVPEPVVQAPVDDEYARSVGDVSVSRDTFEEDKSKILRIIDELSRVMNEMDYRLWLKYVDNESVNYYSQPSNLKKAQARLPVKGLKLNSLQDYFKYVFVPARRGRNVSEIRYISDNYIKAIQVQENQDIVYYYFNKINGFWMVHIPPID